MQQTSAIRMDLNSFVCVCVSLKFLKEGAWNMKAEQASCKDRTRMVRVRNIGLKCSEGQVLTG